MNNSKIYIDSFSGMASELKKGNRTPDDILAVLYKYPRVSTFDMSEIVWLRDGIEQLREENSIISLQSAYPWHWYHVTETGLLRIKQRTQNDI